MTFLESVVLLLGVALLLLQLARRLRVPYPTLLAAAGAAMAAVPGVPMIGMDPRTAMALFVAPALADAAFDYPLAALRKYWRPLVALAVVALLLSAGAVAWLGVAVAGLPLYAAVALGAIVAPPDAAAASAVLSSVKLPPRSLLLLKGESLLNDAPALLLFSAAYAVHTHGALDTGLALRLTISVPGGVLLGLLFAALYLRCLPAVTGTLSGTLLEFVASLAVWMVAEHLHLSAILCVAAFAMAVAHRSSLLVHPRVRIHSFALWDTTVFLLNVIAFLLMGLQARAIVAELAPERLQQALGFAALVVMVLVSVRMAWLVLYNQLARQWRWLRGDLDAAPLRQGLLIGWCGMRGLVTMATAMALPGDFPQRDLIVLTAFCVVLATVVLQGVTLRPLIHRLRLDQGDGVEEEVARIRHELAHDLAHELTHDRAEGRAREALDALRETNQISPEAFRLMQSELDFAEVAVAGRQVSHMADL